MEQILHNRLEQQNRMKEEERQLLNEMKLNYEEITPCSADEVRPLWQRFLAASDPKHTHFDRFEIEMAVKAGVPREQRARVWEFLVSEHDKDRTRGGSLLLSSCCSIMEPLPPPYDYKRLLKDLTSHQHAILVDLGRTFPSHPYFAQQLGPGQLSLFNILKAYSLYDPEVGYCQGLSFIAAALLLHMGEEEAFSALVNLMYGFGLRKQYKPDMRALQVHMYQLSRLVHDRHKDLHGHLEDHEIPMLYAAPWFLTLFASTFPLGFVARVFDFLFLGGGLEVVFRIALVLLGEHKELIMHCDSFESINDFLKSTLPGMSIIQMERIFNSVMELDLSRDLLAYEVEYEVLQEEMIGRGSPPGSVISVPLQQQQQQQQPQPTPPAQPTVVVQTSSSSIPNDGNNLSSATPTSTKPTKYQIDGNLSGHSSSTTTTKKVLGHSSTNGPQTLLKLDGDGLGGSSTTYDDKRIDDLVEANEKLVQKCFALESRLAELENRSKEAEETRLDSETKLASANNTINSYKFKVDGLESRIGTLELERKTLLSSLNQHKSKLLNGHV